MNTSNTNPGSGPELKALDKALAHVRVLVSKHPVGTRLPAMPMMAQRAGVSLVTMWKAVRAMSAQGVLDSSRGRGTFVASCDFAVSDDKTVAPVSLWQRIAVRIERDIAAGHIGRGDMLPSVKALQGQYRVGYRTVRAAMLELSRSGVVQPETRGFRVSPSSHSDRSGAIAVFVYQDHEDLTLRHLDSSLLRTIESQLFQRRLRPQFVRYRRTESGVSFIDHYSGKPWRVEAGDLLGCLWLVLFDHEIFGEICGVLNSTDAPVAVLDDSESKRFPTGFQDSRHVRFIRVSPLGRGGESVARYLLAFGHRAVAFISPRIEKPWALANCQSVERVYATAGPGHRVVRFVTNTPPMVDGSAMSFNYAARALEFVRQTIEPPPGMVHEQLDLHLARAAEPGLMHSQYLWGLACAMQPLLEAAIGDSSVTAWVCADDDEALAALAFLKRRGVRVPGQISLVGFNNSLSALRSNLSSFSDDYETAVRSMIDHVIDPNRRGSIWKQKVVEFDGYVVERGSTGPARSSSEMRR